ncbi:PepSY domain-containing protein [Labilibaculum sp. 44]|uniref:PepSY domain-containing protein n=2 Tax=Labilibaculum euxinus TaxID=2686357 RepID=A0A7M4D9Z6_9BACT|nr:PepSY domain-containing protein [Labilibaculum euxinus]MVB08680.1 PepSY domain-containing protein [Labilibaculum euxinus]
MLYAVMDQAKTMKFLKKYHKWPSLALTFFILLFAISGIVMNHRGVFSSVDVDRKYLGSEYLYSNWNKAAVKSAVTIQGDTALIYGNIGIWKTTDNFKTFQDFNSGFISGVDNRKIEKVIKTSWGAFYAGTLFGLFYYNPKSENWENIDLPVSEERVVDLVEIKNQLFVLTRSHLLKKTEIGFEIVNLLPDQNYDNKISLFKTLWEIHSGEAFGIIGQLFVDFIGLVFILLCVSGLVYFIYPKWIKKLKQKSKDAKRKIKFLKFNLKWHNHFGYWLIIFLVLTTLTGMFLRPPLLIAIVSNRVPKISFTHLDNSNSWFDQLRRIMYDKELDRILLATSESVYYSDDDFNSAPKVFAVQPPISVMGVNVFEKVNDGSYLVGSFSGLFYWIPEKGLVFDYITKKPYVPVKTMGPPISAHPIAGYLKDSEGKEILFDYNLGSGNLSDQSGFTPMPENIQQSPMSLWNLCLETHTGRIYRYIFGKFYILFIPLSGISILWILIMGFVLYWKQKKRKK